MTFYDSVLCYGHNAALILKQFEEYIFHNDLHTQYINRGIKHDFPFINIRNIPREVLITEGKPRGFQHFPRDLANVNE